MTGGMASAGRPSPAAGVGPLELAPRAVWEQLAVQAGVPRADVAAALDAGEHVPLFAALVAWLSPAIVSLALVRRVLETGNGLVLAVAPDDAPTVQFSEPTVDAVMAALMTDGAERAGPPWWQDVAPYAVTDPRRQRVFMADSGCPSAPAIRGRSRQASGDAYTFGVAE